MAPAGKLTGGAVAHAPTSWAGGSVLARTSRVCPLVGRLREESGRADVQYRPPRYGILYSESCASATAPRARSCGASLADPPHRAEIGGWRQLAPVFLETFPPSLPQLR